MDETHSASTAELPETPWITRFRPNPDTRGRLFVFAHAGGGASFFQPWQALMPADIELCAIQLPGRENRFTTPVITGYEALAEALAEHLRPFANVPCALFGHSFGGLLAFTMGMRLAALDRKPALVAVSALRAPHLPLRRRIAELPDAEFTAAIAELGGTAADVFDNRELVELILPALRADFRAFESYEHRQDTKISVPLWACGAADDPLVDIPGLGAWSALAGSHFDLKIYTGGHFYLNNHRPELIDGLCAAIRKQPALAAAG
jgi:medium-chain acyl-[acyl-carrier-protein] hydrolase